MSGVHMRNLKQIRPVRSVAVAALLCGCAGAAERQVSLEPGDVEFERPSPSGEPSLALGAEDRAILTLD